jgi:hypothetical protein
MPRTFQSLRETCQDEDTEFQLSAASTLIDYTLYPVANGTASIFYNVMEYSNYIPKGPRPQPGPAFFVSRVPSIRRFFGGPTGGFLRAKEGRHA